MAANLKSLDLLTNFLSLSLFCGIKLGTMQSIEIRLIFSCALFYHPLQTFFCNFHFWKKKAKQTNFTSEFVVFHAILNTFQILVKKFSES